MPAKSKQQFKMIVSRRSKYKTKKNTPAKWKWIWEKGWIDDVDYDSLPDTIEESFKEFVKTNLGK